MSVTHNGFCAGAGRRVPPGQEAAGTHPRGSSSAAAGAAPQAPSCPRRASTDPPQTFLLGSWAVEGGVRLPTCAQAVRSLDSSGRFPMVFQDANLPSWRAVTHAITVGRELNGRDGRPPDVNAATSENRATEAPCKPQNGRN